MYYVKTVNLHLDPWKRSQLQQSPYIYILITAGELQQRRRGRVEAVVRKGLAEPWLEVVEDAIKEIRRRWPKDADESGVSG
jgi:hypothetical protein